MAPELTYGECLNAQTARQELLTRVQQRRNHVSDWSTVPSHRSSKVSVWRAAADAVGRLSGRRPALQPGLRESLGDRARVQA